MNKLIVALDVDTLKKASKLVSKLYPTVKIFKVGSELFTKAGPAAINMIKKKGARVFLDLKFHDIPNTVKRAVRAAAGLNPFMINIHAQGGADMIKAASGALKQLPKHKRPILLAVTVLTSLNAPIRQVVKLAKFAKACGADGVVCSPKEIRAVRRACGKNFIIVTPGIRPAGKEASDQKRIATPERAIKNGADFIVVGRPVTEADDPKKAAEDIIKEM